MRRNVSPSPSLPLLGIVASLLAGCGSSSPTLNVTIDGGDDAATSSTDTGASTSSDDSSVATDASSTTTTTSDDSSTATDSLLDDTSATDTGSTTTTAGDAGLDDTTTTTTPPTDAGSAADAAPDTTTGTDASTRDGGTPDAVGFVSAAHPRLPIVNNAGGEVLATPTFVSVTFSATYGNAVSDLDNFVATIGNQPYWAATTAEYGVSKPTVHTPVHLTEAAPGRITDSGIQTWLAGKISSGAAGFGDAVANTVFVLSYPAATTITQGGGAASCTDFAGYHGSTSVRIGARRLNVAYAVIPECAIPPSDAGVPDGGHVPTLLENTTETISHELVEAVTDPFGNGPPGTGPAYIGTDIGSMDPYVAWSIGIVGGYGALELGDMCESFGSSNFQPAGYAYYVQRTWSNANVLAGKDPCAPYHTSEAAYFLAQPVFDPNFAVHEAMSPPVYLPVVTAGAGRGGVSTQGIVIPVGGTGTVPVVFWSEAPTAAWTVEAVDIATDNGATTPFLSLSLDKTTGKNGDTATLTIKVLAADTTNGGETFRLTSYDGVLRHTTFGFVAQH